jgi:hypothetical protein
MVEGCAAVEELDVALSCTKQFNVPDARRADCTARPAEP